MEIVGLIAAILGVIAAILNRKRIVVLRYDYGQRFDGKAQSRIEPITVRKRFKRFVVSLGIAIAMPMLVGITGTDSEQVRSFLIWPFGICLLVACYQFIAAVILILAKLWR